jgi:histidine ammonia-lyase
MVIKIPQYKLSLADVELASHETVKINISPQGQKFINLSRKRLERKLAAGTPIYGVNTGFGALVGKSISRQDQRRLQENLILSHALGSGEIFARPIVCSAMFLRANMLSKGYSGVSSGLVRLLVEMINRDVMPAVYEKGSVGASGDLAPLAFIALGLIGRGKAFYQNKLMSARVALKKANLIPIKLEPKEGLALINGTEMMSALAAFNTLMANRMVNLADIAGAFSFVALGGNIKAFDPRLVKLKFYAGQEKSTNNLQQLLKAPLRKASNTQDAYCLRCMPQVHGAIREGIRFAKEIVEIEINSVTDNPLIFDGEVVSGGNFHGQALALAMDNLAISLCALGGISERRISRLLDPNLSGLPAFLTPNPGINSGLMMTQILATSLCAENKILSTPASVQSLPTSANQEDFVSMGMDAALKAKKICENTEKILALELICACQAIELGKKTLNLPLKKYFETVRSVVPFLGTDQELTQCFHNLLLNLKKFSL